MSLRWGKSNVMSRRVWQLMKIGRGKMTLGISLLVLSRLSGLVIPFAPKLIFDQVLLNQRHDRLFLIAVLCFFAIAIQAASSYFLTEILTAEGLKLTRDLRCIIQGHIVGAPLQVFDEFKSGTIVSRIISDVNGVNNFLGQGLADFFGGIVTSVLIVIILFRLDWRMTTITCLFVVGFMLNLFRALKKMRPLYKYSSSLYAGLSGRLSETVNGIKVVKAFNAEVHESVTFKKGADAVFSNSWKIAKLNSSTTIGSLGIVRLLSLISLCVGSYEVMLHRIDIGVLFSYIVYLSYMTIPLTQSISIGSQLSEALAGLERCSELLAYKKEDADPLRTELFSPRGGRIEFDNVHFEYERRRPILHGISFDIREGSVTALVGTSGSGKTTISSLIAGFYVPSSGSIAVDGVDIRRVKLDSYRSSLGIVLQEPFLFDGTIRDNILLSKVDIPDDVLAEACRLSHVNEFLERLPDGSATVVGERGLKLSVGQRQRVALARAIVANPKILLLDEATASLDAESERFVQDALRGLMKGRTTVLIAHRLSTVREADQILVIEKGKVIEKGNHEQLLEKSGRYRELCELQFM